MCCNVITGIGASQIVEGGKSTYAKLIIPNTQKRHRCVCDKDRVSAYNNIYEKEMQKARMSISFLLSPILSMYVLYIRVRWA